MFLHRIPNGSRQLRRDQLSYPARQRYGSSDCRVRCSQRQYVLTFSRNSLDTHRFIQFQ
jgi:hypothetical protein